MNRLLFTPARFSRSKGVTQTCGPDRMLQTTLGRHFLPPFRNQGHREWFQPLGQP